MGEQSRRVPVSLTEEERAEIIAAMKAAGFRSIGDFLRIAGLEKARGR